MLFYFACEAAGASRARHSLRPLISEGRTFPAKLGLAPRDREGVLEIPNQYSAVIASEAKQSTLPFLSNGLLRGACHRARIRATRWLAMTAMAIRPWLFENRS